jgi:hypothetical protein
VNPWTRRALDRRRREFEDDHRDELRILSFQTAECRSLDS